jgi:hypothetical protein
MHGSFGAIAIEPTALQSRIDFMNYHFPEVQNLAPTRIPGMFHEKLQPYLSPKGGCLS